MKADTLSRMSWNKKNSGLNRKDPKLKLFLLLSVSCFLYETIFRPCIETTETNINVKKSFVDHSAPGAPWALVERNVQVQHIPLVDRHVQVQLRILWERHV
jgi:hypothetical protein